MPVKGSDFEREICKQLSLWWTDGERDDVFWRSSQSGGRATQRAKSGKRTAGSYGDVAALDHCGKPFLDRFCLELKRGYGTWSIMDELDKGPKAAKQTFSQFWEQATASAEQCGTGVEPMVIFRKDKRRTCIALYLKTISPTLVEHCLTMPRLVWDAGHGRAVCVMLFDDFVNAVDPKVFTDEGVPASQVVRRRPPPRA